MPLKLTDMTNSSLSSTPAAPAAGGREPWECTGCSGTSAGADGDGGGVHPSLMALEMLGTKSFLRLTSEPTSMTPSSGSGEPGKAAAARAASAGPQTRSEDLSSTTSTTKRSRAAAPSSLRTRSISRSSSRRRSRMAAGAVVSTTDTATVPWKPPDTSKRKVFMSPATSPLSDTASRSLLLALNWRAASSSTSSTRQSLARTASILRSQSVVVGLRRLSVSERMAQSRQPATGTGRRTPSVSARCARMVDMEPQGRTSTYMGPSVWKVSFWKAWWSMQPRSRFIRAFTAGCTWDSWLWSTRQIPRCESSASTSSTACGGATFQRSRTNCVSELRVPGDAAMPLKMYAAARAPAMESMSGIKCPTKTHRVSSRG
mmetsp:Transcript_14408/g.42360  ORF Transcript_14408/g.42360 Transcript_14408/m.42360 type:complete len:373 (+) Transcript_14408:333-1451(+)